MARGSKPGERRGGRKKGTPNKLTASIKDAILHAFATVGGETYLTQVARKDPRTFCALLAKVLPTQLEHSGPNGQPIELDDSPRARVDVARRIAFTLEMGAQAAQNVQWLGEEELEFRG